MNNLQNILKKASIEEACKLIGLDFSMIFISHISCKENPYRDHQWIVKKSKEFIVINAIPEKKEQDRLFWEEWYLHEGEIHHHVLTLWKPETYHEIYEAPDCDDIHPKQSFGSKWYVIEDTDMTPWLLRR